VSEAASLPLFLGSVIAISLTGVMMPGPVTAITIARGAQRKEAGALIAIGHGLVELPLIVLIYLGLDRFLSSTAVEISVGLVGGVVLIWIAINILKNMPSVLSARREMPHNSVIAGFTTTAANPYFYLWWATVGAALLVTARDFGSGAIVAMGTIHWLCDFAWLTLISWTVYKSRRLWTTRVNHTVFGICAAILAGFGIWFIASSIDLAVNG